MDTKLWKTLILLQERPKTVKHVHTSNESKANKNTIEENYTYNYDHAERITSINYTLGNNTITLATNTYDELGRLKSKSHHGSNANSITDDYNIHGWKQHAMLQRRVQLYR